MKSTLAIICQVIKRSIDGSCPKPFSVALVGVLAFIGSAGIGFLQGFPEPQTHDEFSYLLAADTFIRGRLTNPTHPMWVHFETLHVIHEPSYMSKFLPAQGLSLALGQIVGGHPIVGVWISMAFMCASICWMLQAWVPHRWAVLGGLFSIVHPIVGVGGYWAQSYWGGAVAATGGALLLGGMRRLMREPRVPFALAMGIGLTILAISRPYEGLVLSLPTGIAVLLWLFGRHRPDFTVIVRRVFLPLGIVGALTLGGLAFYNYRVTGDALKLPYSVHEKTYSVSPLFIWEGLPPAPPFRHDIIREFHASFELPVYQEKRSFGGFISRNFAALMFFLFFGLSVFAIPLVGSFRSLLRWAWRNRWGRIALLVYLTFVSGIMIAVHNRLHYWAPITALNFLFVAQGMRRWRLRDRGVGQFVIFLVPALALALLAIYSYRSRQSLDELAPYRQRAKLVTGLTQTKDRHLILVKYGLHHSYQIEWVFNEADIDRSKVLWARAMSAKADCKLAEYFKDRTIWSLEIDHDDAPIKLNPFQIEWCRSGR